MFQSFFILRDHTFVTSTWKGDGEDLKNLSRVCGFFCFQKIDLLFIFADEVGGRGSRSFCVGGGGGAPAPPCPFLKIGKKCPNFRGKYPDCGHLCVKFLI